MITLLREDELDDGPNPPAASARAERPLLGWWRSPVLPVLAWKCATRLCDPEALPASTRAGHCTGWSRRAFTNARKHATGQPVDVAAHRWSRGASCVLTVTTRSNAEGPVSPLGTAHVSPVPGLA